MGTMGGMIYVEGRKSPTWHDLVGNLGQFRASCGDYGCGLTGPVYVESRFFQFALMLSLPVYS
jgi:hypothetical protein